MNKSKCKVLLVIMLVVGLSVASAGCDWFGGGDDDDNGGGGGGGTQPSRSVTILDTTLTLNTYNYFWVRTTFHLTQGWPTTVRVTGPANTDPDFWVHDPIGSTVASGISSYSGSETVTFQPASDGTYRLEIHDDKDIGGTFRVLVTQMMQ